MNLQASQANAGHDAGAMFRTRACLAALVVWTFCLPRMATAQDDRSFKEFDRSMVATPSEMLEYLSARGIVAPQTVPLTKNGLGALGDLLSRNPEDLSPQQRELLKNAAKLIYQTLPEKKRKSIESFIRNHGIDSEATRKKLTNAGVPRQWQNELLKQFKLEQKLPNERSNTETPNRSIETANPRGMESGIKNFEQMLQGLESKNNSNSVLDKRLEPPTIPEVVKNVNPKSPVTDNRFLREHLQRVEGVDWSKRLRFPRRSLSDSIDSAEFSRFLERMDQPASPGFSNLLGRLQSTLSNSAKKMSLPKDRVTARFDRLLLKAAERSLNSQENGIEEHLSGPVDSIFASALDEVSKTVLKKNPSAKNNNSKQPSPSAQKNLAQETSPDFTSERPNSPSNEVLAGMPSISMLGSDETNSLLLVNWLTIIVLAGLAIYGVLTWIVVPLLSKVHKQKRTSVRNVSSPGSSHELVSAVDEYLVSKFGSRSRWWNSKFAMQKISGKFPELRSRIFDLFKVYEHLRYAPIATQSNVDEQSQSQATLKLLERETADFEPDNTLLHSMES